MCDNCPSTNEDLESMDLDTHQIAVMGLSIIGVLVEAYCEEGYCDPSMYKSLALATTLAKKLGEEGLAQRLALSKIFAGETVNDQIEKNGMNIDKELWS